jgi:hypothetical protein
VLPVSLVLLLFRFSAPLVESPVFLLRSDGAFEGAALPLPGNLHLLFDFEDVESTDTESASSSWKGSELFDFVELGSDDDNAAPASADR